MGRLSKDQKMSRLSYYFAKVQPVVLAALLVFCVPVGASAQNLPGKEILRFDVQPVSPAQESAAQLHLMEQGAAAQERLIRNVVNAVLLMFLFGAFCTLWAQQTDRNALLWFLLGFAFTLFAVLYILWRNPRKRRKKRYRRVSEFWKASRS